MLLKVRAPTLLGRTGTRTASLHQRAVEMRSSCIRSYGHLRFLIVKVELCALSPENTLWSGQPRVEAVRAFWDRGFFAMHEQCGLIDLRRQSDRIISQPI